MQADGLASQIPRNFFAALVRFTEKVGEGRGDVVLVEQLTRGQGISIVDTGIGRRTANN